MAKLLKNKIQKNNKEKKYLFDYIIDDIKNNSLKNTFVYNEGGIGKTTQIKKLVKMLLSPEGRKYASNIIPIYIAVKDLHGSKKENILFNSIKKFCGEDSSDEELKNLLDGSSSLRKDVIFLFIIDGLNEAKDEIKRELQKEINDLMEFEQNIFIVSSRIDETNYFSGFDKKLFVKPLSNVCEILKVKENEINPKLLEILSIPLYFKYYLDTYKKDDFDFYENKSVKKSDILKEYLNAIDKNYEKSTVSYDKYTKDFLIDFYLPALAYELEMSNEIPDEKLKNIKRDIASYAYYEQLLGVDEEDEIGKILTKNSFFPLKIAKEWFALNNKKGYFVHDIWKEYFTAVYYSKCIDKDIINVFDKLPSEEVREFIGEITGECDFENVTELEKAKESPLNQFLQRHNLQKDEKERLSPIQTSNVIEIMKTSRDNNITAEYSNLNLSYCNFIKTNISNSNFIDSSFGGVSHMPINSFELNMYGYNHLFFSSGAISPDGKYFVQSCEGNIQIIKVDTNEIIDKVTFNDYDRINIRQILFLNDKSFVVNYEKLFAIFVIENLYVDCIAIYPHFNQLNQISDFFENPTEETFSSCVQTFVDRPRASLYFQKINKRIKDSLIESCDDELVGKIINQSITYENMGLEEIDLNSNNVLGQILSNINIIKNDEDYAEYFNSILTLNENQEILKSDNSFEFENDVAFLISYQWYFSPVKEKIHIVVNRKNKKIYFVCDGCFYEFVYSNLLNEYNKNDFDDLIPIEPKKILTNKRIDLILNWKNKGIIGISSRAYRRSLNLKSYIKALPFPGCFLSYYEISSGNFQQKFFKDKYIWDIEKYSENADIALFVCGNEMNKNSRIFHGIVSKPSSIIVSFPSLEEINQDVLLKNIYDVRLINNYYTQVIDYTPFGDDSKYHCFLVNNSWNYTNAYINLTSLRSINANCVIDISTSPSNTLVNGFSHAVAGYSLENEFYHKMTDYYSELKYDSCYILLDENENIQIYLEDTFGHPYWYSVEQNNYKYQIRKISNNDKLNEELIDETVNNFISNKVKDKFKSFISISDYDLDVNSSVKIYPKKNYLVQYNDNYYFSTLNGGYMKLPKQKNACFYKQYCVWFDDPSVFAVFDLKGNYLAYISSSDLDLSADKLKKYGICDLQLCFYDEDRLSFSCFDKTYIFSKSQGVPFNQGVLWKKVKRYLRWNSLPSYNKRFIYKEGYIYIDHNKDSGYKLNYIMPISEHKANIYTLGDAEKMISNHTDIICTINNNELSIWDLRKIENNPSELKPIISNLNMNFVNNYICQNVLFKNIEGLTTYQKEQLSLLGANFE